MPWASRWMLRCSMICFAVGIALGAVMLAHKAYPLHPAVWQLLPVHIELMLFGWIVQFTMGTGYWMLPRYLKGPERGRPGAALAMVLLLNTGIACILADALSGGDLPLKLAGRSLETASVAVFISLHWKRIVSYRHEPG